MFKIKIFVKTSTKKLAKLTFYKNKPLKFLFNFLLSENNKNFNVILKKIVLFINFLNKTNKECFKLNNIKDKIFVDLISCSPAKKLKRIKFRAKGRVDDVEKRNSFLVLGFSKKKIFNDTTKFVKKNYSYI